MEARLYFNDDVQLVIKFDPDTDAYLIANQADGKEAEGTLESAKKEEKDVEEKE